MAIKSSGLNWRRWVDPIESFVQKHSRLTPRWAIICTYECDMERLERDILPLLLRHGRVFRSMVLVDAGTLQQRLKVGKTPSVRVNLHPVRLLRGGIFHPKIVFLRAGNRVCVCFGSANVTNGGLGSNLELWANSDDPEIVHAFTSFFDKLIRCDDVVMDPPAIRALQRAMIGLGEIKRGKNKSPLLWTSLDEPFTMRLKHKNSGLANARRIHLLSPAYTIMGGAKTAMKSFKDLNTTIYTDGVIDNWGAKLVQYHPLLPSESETHSDDGSSTLMPSKLHAKAYLFEGSNDGVLWFGSANLTARALAHSVHEGGNVEILVKTKLSSSEKNKFLNDLKMQFSHCTKMEDCPPPPEPKPAYHGVVLSGELLEQGSKFQLVIHTLPDVNSVRLAWNARTRSSFLVQIKHRRGIVKGNTNLLPELQGGRSGNNWTGVIYEITSDKRIPVLINIPIVPETSTDWQATEKTIDCWIDELFGRWPKKSKKKKKPNSATQEEEDYDDIMPEDDDLRGLDQVDHQGFLDRLAVKSAIIIKRIKTTTKVGGYREKLGKDIRDSLVKTCQPHLKPIIISWFSHLNVRRKMK